MNLTTYFKKNNFKENYLLFKNEKNITKSNGKFDRVDNIIEYKKYNRLGNPEELLEAEQQLFQYLKS